MINWENYEEYMMLHADGELQPAEEQELMAFIDANPQLKSELAAYDLARITPDETIVFADKNSLLRQEPSKRIIAFPQWRKYAIAAGVVAILFTSFYKYSNTNSNTAEIARVDTTIQMQAPKNNTPVQSTPVQSAPVQQPTQQTVATTQPRKAAPALHHEQQQAVTQNKVAVKKQEAIAAVNNNEPFITHPDQINALSVNSMKTLSCNTVDLPAVATVVAIPPPASLPAGNIRKRSFWDNLPVDENKKEEIKAVATVISNAYDKVNKPKESENNVNLDIKHRKLTISF